MAFRESPFTGSSSGIISRKGRSSLSSVSKPRGSLPGAIQHHRRACPRGIEAASDTSNYEHQILARYQDVERAGYDSAMLPRGAHCSLGPCEQGQLGAAPRSRPLGTRLCLAHKVHCRHRHSQGRGHSVPMTMSPVTLPCNARYSFEFSTVPSPFEGGIYRSDESE